MRASLISLNYISRMKFNPKLITLEYYWIIIDQSENRPFTGLIGKTTNSGCYAVNQIVVPAFLFSGSNQL